MRLDRQREVAEARAHPGEPLRVVGGQNRNKIPLEDPEGQGVPAELGECQEVLDQNDELAGLQGGAPQEGLQLGDVEVRFHDALESRDDHG